MLEIRANFRGLGYGKALAMGVIETLFNRGAPHIEVECAPRSSEFFWRRLGFVYKENEYSHMENPKLILKIRPKM